MMPTVPIWLTPRASLNSKIERTMWNQNLTLKQRRAIRNIREVILRVSTLISQLFLKRMIHSLPPLKNLWLRLRFIRLIAKSIKSLTLMLKRESHTRLTLTKVMVPCQLAPLLDAAPIHGLRHQLIHGPRTTLLQTMVLTTIWILPLRTPLPLRLSSVLGYQSKTRMASGLFQLLMLNSSWPELKLMSDLEPPVTQSAAVLVALNISIQAQKLIRWTILFQILDKITILLPLRIVPLRLKRFWDTLSLLNLTRRKTSGSSQLLRLSLDLLVLKKISISENIRRNNRLQTPTVLPLDGVVSLFGQSREQRRMSMQFLDMTLRKVPTKLQLMKSLKKIKKK